jgi:ATP-binding cassette subfamily B protein
MDGIAAPGSSLPDQAPRRLPRLIAITVGIARRAAPRELSIVAGANVIGSLGLVGELLLGRLLLVKLLQARSGHGHVGDLVPVILAIAALGTTLRIVSAVSGFEQRLLGARTTQYARDRVLDVTCAVDLAAFDDPDFHDAVAQAQAGVDRLPSVITMLTGLISALAGMTGAVAALIIVQPLLTAVVLVAAVPLVLASSRRSRLLYRFARAMTASDRERFYLRHILTTREPAQEVRAFELSSFLRARHDRLHDAYLAELRAVGAKTLRTSIAADLLSGALIAGAVIAAVALTVDNRIDLAGGATAAVAVLALGQRLGAASSSSGGLSESSLHIEDFLRLSAWAPAAGSRRAAGAPFAGAPSIEAVGVGFSYPSPGPPALGRVDLRIDPGEVVALVGANGSGKTTLAKLLAGLYAPSEGVIRWNGAEFGSLDSGRLRASVGVVFQDFLRYQLPARDNIAVGRHEAFDDAGAIRRAAERAGADGFIERLPDGYATRLGPALFGGTDVSLGQWQRIALARIFFRDAPFVILDEPSAALDAQAEHELFADFRRLFTRRTVLLITHRLSSVRDADRIYVLDRGHVVEQGCHDDLLAKGGVYAEMFSLQAGPYR